MNKWIEDLNMAIDMAKKSQEKSDLFLESGLSDRSNSKREIRYIFLFYLDALPKDYYMVIVFN